MSQRIHDPTDTGMPVCSTTGTLRETLERLKNGGEFRIEVDFGEETGGEYDADETISSG